MPLRGEDGGRREEAGHRIPRGQHVVDRAFGILGARYEWKSERGVDGVVDRGGAVAVAGDDDHDQVAAQLLQLVIGVPARYRKVSQKDAAALARRGDELRDLLLARRLAHVDRDRALALVEAGPVQASPAMERPAADVD